MMKKNFLIALLNILFFSGCITSQKDSIYNYINFLSFFSDKQGELVLGIKQNFSDEEKYIKFNNENNLWQYEENYNSFIENEVISFENGTTFVKDDNGTILYELTPLTIEEISQETGMSFTNYKAYYNVFKSGKEYKWDRETYVVNIGVEKEKRDPNMTYSFTTVYMVSLIYNRDKDNWIISLIDEIPKGSDRLNYENELKLSNEKYFIDNNISLCHWVYDEECKTSECLEQRCIVKEKGVLSEKKLFGEIVSEEYRYELEKLYSSEEFKEPTDNIYFFDNDKNMHVFYNDVENAKGKYFKYRMYTPENPTTPLYEQQIEWE